MAASDRRDPAVSIVMVTHGRWDWALRALAALRTRRPRASEVLVVDSASPDDTADRVAAAAPWARLLRLEENVGFGGAMNLGAAEARAPLLCVMNSDAVVRPGWWPAMRRRLDDPGVGAVVPLFVDEDGLVREAGSVVGSDGVTVAWGRGLRADDPAVAYPRDVDYGSAACLLVRADAFRSVGGFDPAYGVGFYEDVELCLDLRERGLRTVYEPRAVVVHPVGRSFGAARAAAQSATNREVFLGRRGDRVADRPALGDPDVPASDLLRARDALATHRLLLVARGGLDPAVAYVARRAAAG
ncbi:MAG TPA: glycosyltransferase family 2 protein, partial [Actinomycetota bacterium]